jgi:hypothetical protein
MLSIHPRGARYQKAQRAATIAGAARAQRFISSNAARDSTSSAVLGEIPRGLNSHAEGDMIRKTKEGYKVLSEKGKNLGGPYKSKAEAEKRLRQVEYFKHNKG